ncbi:hypothetical protein GCM10023149_20370 [Mucilaginibacter gynuensis]|uniref:Uncharacterized protein n=1 Tax=Mucilaginibacter gynuensis TaxID=1302236 RepID=A0ABP8GAU3_9SPHI
MKYKTLIVESVWLVAIYVANFIAIKSWIKPINVWEPTLNVNFNDGLIQVEGQGAFIPTFLLAVSLVYFIKEALYRFKRQPQNYITLASTFLSIAALFGLNYVFNMLITLFNSFQQMGAGLSKLVESLPAELGEGVKPAITVSTGNGIDTLIAKMPVVVIITQLVLIIMLAICAICIGRNLQKPVAVTTPTP